MVVAGKQRRSRKFWIGLVVLVLLAVMISVGCGGVAAVALRPQQLEPGLERQAWPPEHIPSRSKRRREQPNKPPRQL